MRSHLTGLALVGALALVAACGGQEDAAAPEAAESEAAATAPGVTEANVLRRRPGLWQQTVSGEISAPVTMKVCLDEAVQDRMSAFGAQASEEMCSENTQTRQPDGSWAFKSVCNMGTGGTIRSEGTASGDFDAKYTVVLNSTTSGAALPQMNRTEKITMEAEWLGACPEGMNPGDMEMPGGITINMSQMGMGGAPK